MSIHTAWTKLLMSDVKTGKVFLKAVYFIPETYWGIWREILEDFHLLGLERIMCIYYVVLYITCAAACRHACMNVCCRHGWGACQPVQKDESVIRFILRSVCCRQVHQYKLDQPEGTCELFWLAPTLRVHIISQRWYKCHCLCNIPSPDKGWVGGWG